MAGLEDLTVLLEEEKPEESSCMGKKIFGLIIFIIVAFRTWMTF